MAKLVVISTTNTFNVTTGDYFEAGTAEKQGVWRKEDIDFKLRGTYILVEINHEKDWKVSNVEDLANGIMKIDTVDTVAPTSLQDLFDKLATALD